MPVSFPADRELGRGAERRGLRLLAARIGVHLRVEHEHVHVAVRREHVVEAAEADVVRPAVAADDPDALLDEVVGDEREPRRLRPGDRARATRSAATRSRCAAMPASAPWSASRMDGGEAVAERPASPASSARACAPRLSSARRMPNPNSALSSNSELDHAGPRPVVVRGVRRGRQVAAVDRRAAGGVGDHRPVAEELGEELQVRRLAAARAGAGVLEQRLEELRALHVVADLATVRVGQRQEEVVVRPLGAPAAAAAAPCRSPCAVGSPCPWPGRPPRRGRSRCSPRARPGSCSRWPLNSRPR